MADKPVLIGGGGIGGLSMALTLQQIGVPCIILESVLELKPLGVGINIQPNAVRELFDLGFSEQDLAQIGVATKEWALVGRNGKEVYSEPRGRLAGYKWPQYSVHRGKLQMMLYAAAQERLGADCVRTGMRVIGYTNTADGVVAQVKDHNGHVHELEGSLLIGADGLHSAIRAQMHPEQPPIQWGGAIMWRGVSKGIPVRTDASFIGLGSHHHRMVMYPITAPDPATGLADINWIAEITVDNSEGWTNGDWNKKVELSDFAHHFDGWDFGWINVPEMLRSADTIYEYPMIDRDPVHTWVDGNVVLMGDAAHAMYPTGSNGASQAIIDARQIGAAMIEHGMNADALNAYDAKLCAEISAVILRNRGAGPFGLLNLLDERCGGEFDNIDDVIPAQERADFMEKYKSAAGFAIANLNAAPPTIAPGATVEARLSTA